MKYRVQALWNQFRTQVMHPASPIHQVKEMQRAFYAGFECALNKLASEMSDDDSLDNLADARMLQEVNTELQQFASDVKAGKA